MKYEYVHGIIHRVYPCSRFSLEPFSPKGGDNMRKYEAVFIFTPDLEEEKRNTLFDRLKGIMEADRTISNVDEWGIRKLAYEINDYTEGYYIIVNFEGTPETVNELDRISKISDGIMRHMVVREDD